MSDYQHGYRGPNAYGMGSRSQRGEDWRYDRGRYGDRGQQFERYGYDEGDRLRERYSLDNESDYGGYGNEDRFGRERPGLWDRMKGEFREGWEQLTGGEDESRYGRRGEIGRTWDEQGSFGGYPRRNYPMSYGGGGRSTSGYGGSRSSMYGTSGMYGGYGYGGDSSGWGRTDERISTRPFGQRGDTYWDRSDERGPWERAKEEMSEGWQKVKETFMGKGPKGYKRSDDRIREDVCDRLTRHPAIDASDIEVLVRGGEVTLTGIVPERRMKRLVEDIVEDIDGVHDVTNQIRVSRIETQQGTSTMRDAGRETSTTSTTTGSRLNDRSAASASR